ncbi:MAG TPA: hypothetical protein VFE53_27060 [Mucilaginibacter sp.]|jgi:hypothetical protein|nr:hypothetical protein [Mucilaginibacter sp.]
MANKLTIIIGIIKLLMSRWLIALGLDKKFAVVLKGELLAFEITGVPAKLK